MQVCIVLCLLCCFVYLGLPRSPSDVNINDKTSTTAVVMWNIATNTLNHPVDYVYVNYHIMGSTNMMSVRVPSSESQLTLEHLIPYTAYIVNVIPNNMAGNSSNPVDRDFTTEVGGMDSNYCVYSYWGMNFTTKLSNLFVAIYFSNSPFVQHLFSSEHVIVSHHIAI